MAKNTADTTNNNNPDPWASADSEPKAKKDKKKKKDKGMTAREANLTAGTPASNTYDDLLGPGSGGSFKAEDHENSLLIVQPISLEEGIKTTFGEKDAIKANVVILDQKAPAKSEEIKDALIFGRVLQGQLQQGLSRQSRVVGTLIKDTASQKPGQKPPWRLTAPTNADIDVARRYLDSLG